MYQQKNKQMPKATHNLLTVFNHNLQQKRNKKKP